MLTKVNSLLKRGDTTTIAVIVCTCIGSFLLGLLVAVLFVFLRTRPTSPPVDSKTNIYRHPTIQRPQDDVYDQAPFSPKSLSRTLARYSLKPSMNMFSKKERIEWSSMGEQRSPQPFKDFADPFSSFGHESFSTAVSEDAAIHVRDVLPRGRRTSRGSFNRSVSVFEDDYGRRTFTVGREGPSPSWSQSTMQESDANMDTPVVVDHKGEDEEPIPLALQDSQKLGSQRTRADPRVTHLGRAVTQYDISAHHRSRLMALSLPQQPERTSCSNIPTEGIPQWEGLRRPQLTIVDPHGVVAVGPESAQEPNTPSSMVTEQDSELTRQTSQRRAVSFYQRQATRHLSLPQNSPLSSRVIPDSPYGVIGNSDDLPRRFPIV